MGLNKALKIAKHYNQLLNKIVKDFIIIPDLKSIEDYLQNSISNQKREKLCNFCKIPTQKKFSKNNFKIHQWIIGFKLSKIPPIYVYEKKLIIIESGGVGAGSHVSCYY